MNKIKLKTQLKLEKIETDTWKQLDQLKSRFFANISHEFRTPLTLILGQVESVISSSNDLSEKDKLQVATRNARRLLTLINQLLDLAKIEAGNMELNVSQNNIVSFVKCLFFSFESLASLKEIKFTFETDSDNIPMVFDIDKMEKVFYNLFSNAIKFSISRGEINVRIRLFDFQTVEIQIHNNGLGIPEDQLSGVFNRFFQADNSGAGNFEGTGIGLALVKELVELHHGIVTVTSNEKEGTAFTLKLPVGEVNQGKSANEIIFSKQDLSSDFLEKQVIPETDFLMPKTEKTFSKIHEIVLVVEDNNDIRAFIREQLEPFYQVFEAENGETAMKLALEIIPDLIVSDLMMPKVNGFEFCKLIRGNERTSHIPVIMLTAKANFDDKLEGLETGIDDYIIKPFNARELIVRTRNLINQRKLLRSRFKTSTVIMPSEVTAISIDQLFLEKVIKTIEANFDNQDFTIDSLAESTNMSVSQLNRKLNALIEQPAGQLMRSLRLLRAADLLKQNAGNISEICYQLDFNDPAYFSRAFKKQFGCSPTEFMKN